MKKRTGSNIYNRWRPRRFEEFVGNHQVVKAIQVMLGKPDPPRSWLFHGASGTGKTTMARILAASQICESKHTVPCGDCDPCNRVFTDAWQDYYEINCADRRGIDAMRELLQTMRYAGFSGGKKVYVLDEVQQATKDASQALLKAYEDGIGDSLLVLCTTEPQDILKTLRTRAYSFEFKPWTYDEAVQACMEVFREEGASKISEDQVRKFVAKSHDSGITSPRALLSAVEKVISANSLSVIDGLGEDNAKEVIEICRAVLAGNWSAVVRNWNHAIDADQIRLAVCGYLKSVLLKETDMVRGVAVAEALKEIAQRVDDHKTDPGVVARLFLATARLSLTERR